MACWVWCCCCRLRWGALTQGKLLEICHCCGSSRGWLCVALISVLCFDRVVRASVCGVWRPKTIKAKWDSCPYRGIGSWHLISRAFGACRAQKAQRSDRSLIFFYGQASGHKHLENQAEQPGVRHKTRAHFPRLKRRSVVFVGEDTSYALNEDI